MTTPADPGRVVEEVRVEHGGVYVLSHLPEHGAQTYVGGSVCDLQRAAAEIRLLLPDRYRQRVTAALVLPTDPAHHGRVDVAASVGGVLILDAASLAHAVRWATPALSTSEVSVVEGVLRRQMVPQPRPTAGGRRRWRLSWRRVMRIRFLPAV